MPQPKNETLVPLDESDFLAHCERQEQEIRKLKAALAEKDEQITAWRNKQEYKAEVFREEIRLKDGQIATLKANAEFLSSELERLRSRVVLTPAESHLTLQAALKEGGKP